jgi:hypothetical protein
LRSAREFPVIPKYAKCPSSFRLSAVHCSRTGSCRYCRHQPAMCLRARRKRFAAVFCFTTQYPLRDTAQKWVKPNRSKLPVQSSAHQALRLLPSLHGVPRVGSPASPVLRNTPTSCAPSASLRFLRFLRFAVPPRLGLRSRRRKTQRPQARGFHRSPQTGSSTEATGPPRFLEDPL